MIRYYFDIVIDDDVTVDEEGELLLDVGSARQEAARTLAEIARDHLLLERTIAHLSIIVRTAKGRVCEVIFQWDPKSLQ
ncbi:hypothetical protein [Bradyrhizobium sp. OAE829]|uniref:DUF6894 family protein n=1 Tax=Bradyrhizobium sp. OAE829 TaxID=2663807 RepID=UPI00178AA625